MQNVLPMCKTSPPASQTTTPSPAGEPDRTESQKLWGGNIEPKMEGKERNKGRKRKERKTKERKKWVEEEKRKERKTMERKGEEKEEGKGR